MNINNVYIIIFFAISIIVIFKYCDSKNEHFTTSNSLITKVSRP